MQKPQSGSRQVTPTSQNSAGEGVAASISVHEPPGHYIMGQRLQQRMDVQGKGKEGSYLERDSDLSPPPRNTYSGKTSHKAEVLSISVLAVVDISRAPPQVDRQDEDPYSGSYAADSVGPQGSPHLMVKDNTQT